jgi:uncharacterized protein YigE (DUF2233 family)
VRKYSWMLAALLILAAGLLAVMVYFAQRPKSEPPQSLAALPSGCADVTFESSVFIVCSVDPANHRIELALNDLSGKPWRSLERFAEAKRSEGRPILFAMNAGMYHEDLSPVGLFIGGRQRLAPLQIGSGTGNFFLMPNGVFGVYSNGQPFVVTTEIYPLSPRVTEFATQSGPMLVIDGAIHPKFDPDGASRFIRNGVGVDDEGRAVFAISRDPVSFGKFARLFRDELQCRNALYFDGVVSAFSDGDSTIIGGQFPAGPIVAVFGNG